MSEPGQPDRSPVRKKSSKTYFLCRSKDGLDSTRLTRLDSTPCPRDFEVEAKRALKPLKVQSAGGSIGGIVSRRSSVSHIRREAPSSSHSFYQNDPSSSITAQASSFGGSFKALHPLLFAHFPSACRTPSLNNNLSIKSTI